MELHWLCKDGPLYHEIWSLSLLSDFSVICPEGWCCSSGKKMPSVCPRISAARDNNCELGMLSSDFEYIKTAAKEAKIEVW